MALCAGMVAHPSLFLEAHNAPAREVRSETGDASMAVTCTYDPTNDLGGMFHCPECGEMILAGAPHPDYSLLENEPMATPEMSPNEEVEAAIIKLFDMVNKHKPNDRSEKDRLWAILRTDVQKLLAFWFYLEMQ